MRAATLASLFIVAVLTLSCGAQQQAPDLAALMAAAPRTPPKWAEADPKADSSDGGKMSSRLHEAIDDAAGLHGKAVDFNAVVPVAVSARNLTDAERLEAILVQAGAFSIHRNGLVLRAHMQRRLAADLSRAPEVSYISTQSAMTVDGHGGDAALPRLTVVRSPTAEYTGAGIRVGIIDFGFAGYARLKREGLLPEPAAFHGFGLEEGHSLENGEPHGTACAEILHAVAPGAGLYLAMTDGSPGAWQDAANWMRAEKVDIVHFAGSWIGAELDGNDPLSRMLDEQSRQDDRLWVVSAGNAGKLHWLLPEARPGKGGWIGGMSLLGNDTLLAMQPGEIQDVSARAGSQKPKTTYALRVVVRWNDSSAEDGNRSGQDLDACLYVIPSPGEKPRELKCSKERQSANPSIPPEEEISLTGEGLRGQVFYLGLHAARVTRPLRVHIFVSPSTARLANSMPGSILSPATSHTAVAVGAFDIRTGLLADYSSQGPTDDGRVKPDVAGPADGYVEALEGPFHGTSASSSFAAGLAAVRASMPDHLRGQALAAALRGMAAPSGNPVPNNRYGSGLVSAASLQLLPAQSSFPAAEIVRQTPALVPGVPAAWGGPVPFDVLEAIRTRPRSAWQGQAKIVTGRELYHVGDGLKLGLEVDSDRAYLLFYRSENGEYLFLEPRGQSVTVLPGGRGFPFPAGGDSLRLDATWLGRGEFIFITAPQPVNWLVWKNPHALSDLSAAPVRVVEKDPP